MVTKLGKITLTGAAIVIGTYLWKISLGIIIIALFIGLYVRIKNKNRSDKWD